MEEMGNTYKNLVAKSEEQSPLEIRIGWEKITEIEWKDVARFFCLSV
jgi:hypothetical protein